MRLRSTQFVFVLLLVCSVRQWESPAGCLQAVAASRPAAALARYSGGGSRRAGAGEMGGRLGAYSSPMLRWGTVALTPVGSTAHRLVVPAKRAGEQSAAVSTFTGRLRG